MKKVELLAPAGNYQSFLGAIHAGADAVYIGGQKYGARAYADNFSDEEVCLAIRYAHLFDRKVYLTVNTLLRQQELEELEAYLRPFYEEGLDGVIVQDFGVVSLLRRAFPDLPIHGSTQMTITGADGASFLLEQGISRVVPARELSLEEIAGIKETGIEVEAFIHGAMCYCYSGQCLFSSILGGRSGNRGKCAQPCRLPYDISPNGGKEIYPLSLKDMCTLSFLPELIQSGMDSFKIEGRMKRPEYAAGVTALYRKYIDRYYDNPQGKYFVEEADLEKLKTLYIRSEIQDGYYYKHNGKDMITLHAPGYLGTDENYLEEIRNRYLQQMPKLPILGEVTLQKGRPAMLRIRMQKIGKSDVTSICYKGQMVDAAQKQPLLNEHIQKQLNKTGNTPFFWQELYINMEKDVFLPVKALNDLRREALQALEDAVCAPHKRILHEAVDCNQNVQNHEVHSQNVQNYEVHSRDVYHSESVQPDLPYYAVQIQQTGQLSAVLQNPEVDRIYVELPFSKLSAHRDRLAQWKMEKSGRSLFLVSPLIVRASDARHMEVLLQTAMDDLWDGILVRNTETLSFLKKHSFAKQMVADSNLYIWNRSARQFYEEQSMVCTAPLEANKKQWHAMGIAGTEVVVYGRYLMMVTANCIRKTLLNCTKEQMKAEREQKLIDGCIDSKDIYEKGYLSLYDRYQTEFPVRCVCSHCYNEIYNSVPVSLHDYGKSVVSENPAGIRLIFTKESEWEVEKVMECYRNYLTNPEAYREAEFAFTKGHYKRGAE